MLKRSRVATGAVATTLLLVAAGCVTIQAPTQVSDSSGNSGAINGGSRPTGSGTSSGTTSSGTTASPTPTPTPVPYGSVSWTAASGVLPNAVSLNAGTVISTGPSSSAFVVVGGIKAGQGGLANDVTVFPFSSGTLGQASQQSAFPFAVCSLGLLSVGSNAIALGGRANSGSDIASTSVGVLSNGSISSWVGTTVLSEGRQDAGCTADGQGHVYVVGGNGPNSAAKNTIVIGTLAGGGTVSSWQTSSNTLPSTRVWPAVTAYNNVLYVVGGANDGAGGALNNDVMSYAIASDGTLSAGQPQLNVLDTGGTLPSTAGAGLVAYNGKLYLFGGQGASWNCYVSVINQGGQLTPWHPIATSNDPPQTSSMAFGVDGQGHIFMAGGLLGSGPSSTPTNKVYVGTIQ